MKISFHMIAKSVLIFAAACSCALAERQQIVPLKIDRAPVLDGSIDDPCWSQAKAIELSPMRAEDESIPATRVQAAYTADAVYVAFTCMEPKPDHLLAGQEGRCETWTKDSVELFLDTNADQVGYFQLGFTPGGGWMANYCDKPQNGVPISSPAEFKTNITADRYTIEIKVDFASLAGSGESPAVTWNVAFGRYRRLVDGAGGGTLAVWKGYLMDGLHHQPRTWGDLGPFENINTLARAGSPKNAPVDSGVSWDFPSGIPEKYMPRFSRQLDPSLAWIRSQRLRIAWSWLTSPIKYVDNAQHQHEFQDVVDLAVSSGFNVVIPNAPCQGKERMPYHLWANLDGMTRVRLAGAQTMFYVGYVWGYDHDPARQYDRYVSADGKTQENMICPLEPYPWRDNLVVPVRDALAEAQRLGVGDLFFGAFFDMEPQASMGNGVDDTYGYCHSDRCWRAYAAKHAEADASLPLAQRKNWLKRQKRTEEYQKFQRQAVTEMVRTELSPLRKIAPNLVLGVYPFHQGISWMTESVAAAISTPRAPALLMDDQTYYTGWSGKPDYVQRVRSAVIEQLGHEPLYCASLDYAEREPYPAYTVDRAGREMYLLTKSAAGCVAYAGSRNSGKDLLADQREYYTLGFAPAHALLAKEKVIDRAVPRPPRDEDNLRFEAALAQLQVEVESMWGDVHGVAFKHIDVPASGIFDGVSPLVLTKELSQSSIYNTTAAVYTFDLALSRAPTKASLELMLEPRDAARTRVYVKVNGQRIDHPKIVVPADGRVQVEVPTSLITERTQVSIAYFYGDSYSETRFDNSLSVRRVELMVE